MSPAPSGLALRHPPARVRRRARLLEAPPTRSAGRRLAAALVLGAVLASAVGTAFATNLLDARRLMKAGRFEEAMAAFLPMAAGGNADAEELIGVMYAMGLGVERDDERAFDWYLRASMKGHPGAQSGIGWYYETGRGVAGVDLVRAYAWYVLSAIGGDPDAAVSQEEVVKKMKPDEIRRARRLVADYRPLLYPYVD